jgi:WD40-like Beta Propeller Repeat
MGRPFGPEPNPLSHAIVTLPEVSQSRQLPAFSSASMVIAHQSIAASRVSGCPEQREYVTMRDWLTLGLQLALLAVLSSVVHGQNGRPLAAPDSVILSGWEYGDRLFISTPAGSFPVQGPPGSIHGGYFVLPALAPAGDRIAWGLTLPDDSPRTKCDPSTVVACALPGPAQYKSVIGVYSLRDKTWKTYGDFCDRGAGSAAFSPDGTKIAFKASMRTQDSICGAGYETQALLILDLATGQFTHIPNTARVMANARTSWSPDGKYLAVQISDWGTTNSIVLIQVGSWAQKAIAKGANPSWSPRGDWIAYDTGAGMACKIAHPDGTDAKLILDAFSRRGWGNWEVSMGAVWSPDGKTLWLNEQEDTGPTEVDSVDLATGKVKKVSKDTPYVFGWVLQPHNAAAATASRPDSAPEH